MVPLQRRVYERVLASSRRAWEARAASSEGKKEGSGSGGGVGEAAPGGVQGVTLPDGDDVDQAALGESDGGDGGGSGVGGGVLRGPNGHLLSNVFIHLRKAADHPLLFRTHFGTAALRRMAEVLADDEEERERAAARARILAAGRRRTAVGRCNGCGARGERGRDNTSRRAAARSPSPTTWHDWNVLAGGRDEDGHGGGESEAIMPHWGSAGSDSCNEPPSAIVFASHQEPPEPALCVAQARPFCVATRHIGLRTCRRWDTRWTLACGLLPFRGCTHAANACALLAQLKMAAATVRHSASRSGEDVVSGHSNSLAEPRRIRRRKVSPRARESNHSSSGEASGECCEFDENASDEHAYAAEEEQLVCALPQRAKIVGHFLSSPSQPRRGRPPPTTPPARAAE